MYADILASAPNYWWRCGDPGGILLQDIGSNPHAPLYVQQGLPTPYVGAMSDGGAAVIAQTSHCGNNLPLLIVPSPPAHFTIEFFVYPLDLPSPANNLFELAVSTAHIGIDLPQNARPRFYFSGFGGNPTCQSGSAISLPGWHQIAAVWNAGTMLLYVDGALVNTTATAADPSDTYSVYLGQSGGGVGGAGAFSDVQLYTRALGGPELLGHFNTADNLPSTPTFTGAGSYPTPTFGNEPPAALLDLIYAAVHKVY